MIDVFKDTKAVCQKYYFIPISYILKSVCFGKHVIKEEIINLENIGKYFVKI